MSLSCNRGKYVQSPRTVDAVEHTFETAVHSIVAPYDGEQTLELKCKAKENFDTSTHSVEAVEENFDTSTHSVEAVEENFDTSTHSVEAVEEELVYSITSTGDRGTHAPFMSDVSRT